MKLARGRRGRGWPHLWSGRGIDHLKLVKHLIRPLSRFRRQKLSVRNRPSPVIKAERLFYTERGGGRMPPFVRGTRESRSLWPALFTMGEARLARSLRMQLAPSDRMRLF